MTWFVLLTLPKSWVNYQMERVSVEPSIVWASWFSQGIFFLQGSWKNLRLQLVYEWYWITNICLLGNTWLLFWQLLDDNFMTVNCCLKKGTCVLQKLVGNWTFKKLEVILKKLVVYEITRVAICFFGIVFIVQCNIICLIWHIIKMNCHIVLNIGAFGLFGFYFRSVRMHFVFN